MSQKPAEASSVSLNPEDYAYPENPTREQWEEQRRLLGLTARQEAGLGLPASKPPAAGHHTYGELEEMMLMDIDLFGGTSHPGGEESGGEWAAAAPRKEGAPAGQGCGSPVAGAGKDKASGECSAAGAERSASDASASTLHHDEGELLLDNLGSWRDWMALEWQHHHHPAQGQQCGTEATSPPGTFLKLNHEATAQLLNCALHQQAA